MSKQIFSKIAKIGEDIRTIKVEFASSAITQLIAGLKAQSENLDRTYANSTKYLSDLDILKRKAAEEVSVANKVISNAELLIADAFKAKQQLNQQASELGINVNDIPIYKELIDFERKIKSNLDSAQSVSTKLFGLL